MIFFRKRILFFSVLLSQMILSSISGAISPDKSSAIQTDILHDLTTGKSFKYRGNTYVWKDNAITLQNGNKVRGIDRIVARRTAPRHEIVLGSSIRQCEIDDSGRKKLNELAETIKKNELKILLQLSFIRPPVLDDSCSEKKLLQKVSEIVQQDGIAPARIDIADIDDKRRGTGSKIRFLTVAK